MEQLEIYLNQVNQWSEWGRDQIQTGFDWYRNLLGMCSDPVFDILSPMIIHVVTFTIVGAFYSFLDYFRWPKFLHKYKTSDTTITGEYIAKLAKLCIFNQLVVIPPASITWYWLGTIRGIDRGPRVPSLATMLYHLLVCIVIVDIGFYYIHRLFHRPTLYRKYHKVHHNNPANQAMTAIYSHPMEFLFSNIVPVVLGPLLMGSHRSFISIWLAFVVVHVMVDHSGYHFPLCAPPQYHEYHHIKITENFSGHQPLDTWHGTNRKYWNTIYAKRYRTLFSLTPIEQLVPDDENKSKISTEKGRTIF